MNSTEQNLGMKTLLGPTETNVMAGKATNRSSFEQDNSLKNKDFSSFMGDQGNAKELAGNAQLEDSLGDLGVIESQSPLVMSNYQATDSGNNLPVDGSVLPLGNSVNVPQEWQAQGNGVFSALSSSGELAMFQSEESIAGILNPSAEPSLSAATPQLSYDIASSKSAQVSSLAETDARNRVALTSPAGLPASAFGVNSLPPIPLDSAPTPTTSAYNSIIASADLVTDQRGRLTSQIANMGVAAPLTVGQDGFNSDGGLSLMQNLSSGSLLPKVTDLGASVSSAVEALAAQTSAEVSQSAAAIKTGAHQTYRSSAEPTLQTAVPVEVGKPGWSDSVMQRVMWMSSQNISKAEIALDPPELGPMHVKVSSTGDQTSIVFTSHNAAVREALDQSLARLREMMESQGVNLSDVDVSDENTPRQQAQAGSESLNEDSDSTNDAVGSQQDESEAPALMQSLSLVDQYV
jgi:flagellar hook-length control protein FliK